MINQQKKRVTKRLRSLNLGKAIAMAMCPIARAQCMAWHVNVIRPMIFLPSPPFISSIQNAIEGHRHY